MRFRASGIHRASVSLCGKHLQHQLDRCDKCPRGRPKAPPSGTGRGLRRTAAGCIRARSRGCRRRPSRRPALRLRADVVAVIESHRARASATPAWPRRGRPWLRCERFRYSSGSRVRSSRCLFERHAVGHVAVQRIVRAGLVGEHIGHDAAAGQLRHARRRSCPPGPRTWLAFAHCASRRMRSASSRSCAHAVAIARVEAALDALRDPRRCRGSTRRSWWRPAAARRPCRPCRRKRPACRPAIPPKCLRASGGEGFVGALHDALAADVNPRPGRHLAVHGEAQAFEPR